MNIFLYISIFLLILVFIQDIFKRAIWWFLPLAIFLVGILLVSKIDYKSVFQNLIFIFSVLLLLFIYVKLRFKNTKSSFLECFALGDVLILVAITPYFEFNILVYVFTFGTCFSLLVHVLASFIKEQKTVPYAGYISFFVATTLLVENLQLIHIHL